MIITIDGPAGCGKTTVARNLARELRFLYFDTGAIYRSITYYMLKNRIDWKNGEKLKETLAHFRYEIAPGEQGYRYLAAGEDVTEKIRIHEVNLHVSEVSALAPVREYVLMLTRSFGQKGDAIFEGRDMGSVVFPQADLKIFLSARPAVRAERRYLELKEENHSKEEVLELLLKRDEKDSTRALAPLMQPEGSHLIDTSDLSVEQVIEKILALAGKKRGGH